MQILVLALVFATALVTAGILVVAFESPIDSVLSGLIEGHMAEAWSKYAKFALFVLSFAGGLRLGELTSYAQAATVPVTGSQCLLEAFRSLIGALTAGCWALLAIFGIALLAHVGRIGYQRLAGPSDRRREEHRTNMPSGRF